MVLYNPDEHQVLENIKVISSNVSECFVIVNSCGKSIVDKIQNIKGVRVIDNRENIGLSKSINIGLKEVLKGESETVILFDQDSLPSRDFFHHHYKTYQFLMQKNTKIGSIGANSEDKKRIDYSTEISENAEKVKFVITSGCLIPIETLKTVGLMDETFFIDYIDYEWCFRAASNGYQNYVSTKSIMEHNLGDNLVSILNIKKPIHNNVIRHYHIIRNQLIILCRNYVPLKWRIMHFFKIFYRIPGYIFYSSNRIGTVKNIYKAFIDFAKLNNKDKYTF